jgi:hypothetical protein
MPAIPQGESLPTGVPDDQPFAVGPPVSAGNPTPADPSHPKSAEELKAAFIKAFESGDKAALEKLVYWGDTSEEQRKLTRAMMEDAGKAKIIDISVRTFTDEEPDSDKWTLSSDTQFEIEYEKPTSGNVMGWAFGEINGNFYLGAWLGEQPAAPPVSSPDPQKSQPVSQASPVVSPASPAVAPASQPVTINPSPIDGKHPKTPGELKIAFRDAYTLGDKATLEKLIHWGDSTEENRAITRANLIDDAGTMQVTGIKIETNLRDSEKPDYKWTFSPQHKFNVKLENEDEGRFDFFSWPYGEIDDKYYLGAWDADEPGATPPR